MNTPSVLLLVSIAAGCSAAEETYQAHGIAFRYPGNFEVREATRESGVRMLTVLDPEDRSKGLLRVAILDSIAYRDAAATAGPMFNLGLYGGLRSELKVERIEEESKIKETIGGRETDGTKLVYVGRREVAKDVLRVFILNDPSGVPYTVIVMTRLHHDDEAYPRLQRILASISLQGSR